MDLGVACRAAAPAALCQYSDVLVYLFPSALLALLIRFLVGVHPVFLLFTLAGTVCHELAHALAGWVTGAAPVALTVIARRQGRTWQLGSVTLRRIRWYNAAPTALAPLLLLLIPLGVALWRTVPGWRFQLLDLLLAALLAPQWLSWWPSAVDWRIALQSWPYLLLLAPFGWLGWRFHPQLFQFVM